MPCVVASGRWWLVLREASLMRDMLGLCALLFLTYAGLVWVGTEALPPGWVSVWDQLTKELKGL
jgi:hypothetical protein